VCRVLARRLQNDAEYFLVAFFQAEHSPCLVPREYLFDLPPRVAFPVGDDDEFARSVAGGDISVDWLLERVFIAAQVLAIDQAEVLYPVEQVSESALSPDPHQVQQRLFQCVSCAALLVLCYVASKWRIPPKKLAVMVPAILQANRAKFVSTASIMAQVGRTMAELLASET
jgi:hypothetical protein